MNKNVLKLTETGIMIGLSVVLSLFAVVNLPFGGSVTMCSMVPMVVIAYRHKTLWGIMAGGVYGIVQMILGASNLSYGTSFLAVVAIVLFDYLVAYGATGLGGIFRDKLKGKKGLELALGGLLACAVRFVCHYISGVTVWAGFAEDAPVWLYSLVYNGSYMLPETIVTVVACALIGRFLDIKGKEN